VRSKHKILRVHAGEVPRATPQTPSPGGTHDAQSSQGQGQPPFPVGSSAATGRRWTSAIPLLPSVSPSLLSLIHGASYRETAALLPSSSPRSTNLHLSLHILHLLHLTGTAPPCSMPSLVVEATFPIPWIAQVCDKADGHGFFQQATTRR